MTDNDSKPIWRNSIGKQAALALAYSRWWEGKSPKEIARFQLFTDELCIPFSLFHEALEKSLGRPVWTHELALNYEGIVREFLGQDSAPSMQDIINLIPEDKRILIVTSTNDSPTEKLTAD